MAPFLMFMLSLTLASTIEAQDFLNPGSTSVLLEVVNKIGGVLQSKCLKKVGQTEFVNIMKSYEQKYQCFAPGTDNAADCGNAKNQKCLRDALEVLKPCLDSDEKYFPNFILYAQSQMSNSLCTPNYTAQISRLGKIKCTTPIGKLTENEAIYTCVPELNVVKNANKQELSLKKQEICSDVQMYKNCISKAIKKNCEVTDEDLKIINSLNAFEAPCQQASSSHAISSYSIVYLLAVYMSVKVFF